MFNVPAIIKRLDLKPGDLVADFGTGREGRMALSAAKYIGDEGIAYAVDIVKRILPAIQTKAATYGINNVKTIWSDLEIYGACKEISDNSLEVGFLVTTLFQTKKHADMIKECLRMIKPGGKLVMVDWKPDKEVPLGPANDSRVHPEDMKKIAADMGLRLQEEFEAGQCHWGLIFIK